MRTDVEVDGATVGTLGEASRQAGMPVGVDAGSVFDAESFEGLGADDAVDREAFAVLETLDGVTHGRSEDAVDAEFGAFTIERSLNGFDEFRVVIVVFVEQHLNVVSGKSNLFL